MVYGMLKYLYLYIYIYKLVGGEVTGGGQALFPLLQYLFNDGIFFFSQRRDSCSYSIYPSVSVDKEINNHLHISLPSLYVLLSYPPRLPKPM